MGKIDCNPNILSPRPLCLVCKQIRHMADNHDNCMENFFSTCCTGENFADKTWATVGSQSNLPLCGQGKIYSSGYNKPQIFHADLSGYIHWKNYEGINFTTSYMYPGLLDYFAQNKQRYFPLMKILYGPCNEKNDKIYMNYNGRIKSMNYPSISCMTSLSDMVHGNGHLFDIISYVRKKMPCQGLFIMDPDYYTSKINNLILCKVCNNPLYWHLETNN